VREHHAEPVRGLPGLLPPGERILWQGAPDWRALLWGAFMGRAVALWFIALMGWRFGGGLAEGSGLATATVYAAWTLPVMAAAFAVLGLLAWATARATIYTVTNRRVVIRMGVAIQMSANVPFSRITNVALRSLPGDLGDIPLTVGGPDRFSWYTIRLRFVAFTLQIINLEVKDAVGNTSSNIFVNDPSRLTFPYSAKHLRPEVTVIFFALSQACNRMRLTGISSCKDVNLSPVNCKVCCFNISIIYSIWPVCFQIFS